MKNHPRDKPIPKHTTFNILSTSLEFCMLTSFAATPSHISSPRLRDGTFVLCPTVAGITQTISYNHTSLKQSGVSRLVDDAGLVMCIRVQCRPCILSDIHERALDSTPVLCVFVFLVMVRHCASAFPVRPSRKLTPQMSHLTHGSKTTQIPRQHTGGIHFRPQRHKLTLMHSTAFAGPYPHVYIQRGHDQFYKNDPLLDDT